MISVSQPGFSGDARSDPARLRLLISTRIKLLIATSSWRTFYTNARTAKKHGFVLSLWWIPPDLLDFMVSCFQRSYTWLTCFSIHGNVKTCKNNIQQLSTPKFGHSLTLSNLACFMLFQIDCFTNIFFPKWMVLQCCTPKTTTQSWNIASGSGKMTKPSMFESMSESQIKSRNQPFCCKKTYDISYNISLQSRNATQASWFITCTIQFAVP